MESFFRAFFIFILGITFLCAIAAIFLPSTPDMGYSTATTEMFRFVEDQAWWMAILLGFVLVALIRS